LKQKPDGVNSAPVTTHDRLPKPHHDILVRNVFSGWNMQVQFFCQIFIEGSRKNMKYRWCEMP
jgi:hypothetical protein